MIGRSMLAYIPVNLANLLVSFGTIVILTRLLDSEEFGRYALAIVTMHFTHMGLFTWLEAAMARYQARAERENDVNSHLRTIYSYAVATGAAGLSLIMVTIWALPISSTMKLILSFSLGMLLILFTPLRELAPFIGIFIGLILALIVDVPFMLKHMKGGTVQPQKAKLYFSYGMPICISLLLAYALNSADMYIIAGLMGEASAGQYNAGYNLANRTIEMMFIWISMAVTPIAVTLLEKEGLEKSRVVMKDYGASLLWIAMPAATGIALVSKEFGFILGDSVRAEAVTVMPLIAFAGVLNGLISYYAQRAFMLSGKTGMFVWAMVPPVIINIGLNFWLIPKFGLMGAVYATIFSYTLGFIFAMIVGRRYYPLPVPVKAFFEIAIACIGMAFVVKLLPISDTLPDFIALSIKALIGGYIYLVISFTINAANSRTLVTDFLNNRRPKATTS